MLKLNRNQLKIGIIISYVTLFASIVCGFFITPKVLNYVGSEYYGLLTFSSSITSWLTIISAALSASYIRFASIKEKEEGTDRRVTSLYKKAFALMSIILLTVFLVVIRFLSISGFTLQQYSETESNILYLLIIISGIQVCVTILLSVYNLYCNYKREFVFLRSVALVTSLLNFGLNLLLAFLTKSIIAVAISSLILTVLSNVAIAIYAVKIKGMKTDRNISFAENKTLVRSILIFSSFVVINAVINEINGQMDKQILGVLVNGDAVTRYQLAYSFTGYIATMSVSVSSVFVPEMNRLVVNNKKQEIDELFLKVSKIQTIIILFVVFGFICVGKQFVRIWVGKAISNCDEIYYYSCVLLLINVIPNTMNLYIEVQRAMNKHKFRTFCFLGIAILNLIISVTLVKIFPTSRAIWGVIIGTGVSVLLGTIICMSIYNLKIIKLPIGKYYLAFLKILSFALASFSIQYLLSKFLLQNHIQSNLVMLLINGVFFVITYSAFILIFERKTIRALIKR